MKFLLFYICCVAVLSANVDRKTKLKKEIEAVANESQNLANELSDLLLGLEVAELEQKADESAIVDDEDVENILKAMESRIKKLENNSEDGEDQQVVNQAISSKEEALKVLKKFSDNEERLRASLEKFKHVTKDVKDLALSAQSNANDSQNLANALADMLSYLKEAELEEKAQESAIVNDKDYVQNILKSMVSRIKQLENSTEDREDRDYEQEEEETINEVETIKEEETIEEDKTIEEEELTVIRPFSDNKARLRTLDKFKQVTNDVKDLAIFAQSEDEINSVNRMAKILMAMTAKLKLEEVKISVDLAFGKGKKVSIVKNDIETMIDSLMAVVGQLSEDAI